MTVIIGVDPHERSHTAVALDEDDEQLDQLRVVADLEQVDRLLAWAGRWPDRLWASNCRRRGWPSARDVLELDVHTGQLEDAPQEGPFDVVAVWDTIEHVPDPLAVMTTVASLLAGTGRAGTGRDGTGRARGPAVITSPIHTASLARLDSLVGITRHA